MMIKFLFSGFLLLISFSLIAQDQLNDRVAELAAGIEKDMIKWRRHIHENPELSNREFETAAMVTKHLEGLGIQVQTEVAHTGVVGVLEGGKPGPVVALRADMDALPVKERADLPFASKAKGEYKGQEVDVMHACGHDTHVAILMAVASVLAEVKADLPGTVKFIFQPAEEGSPEGEEGGADMMIREGALQNPDAAVIFGLHINSQTPVGTIKYRSGGMMAAADIFQIAVEGKQTHGSTPWDGVDPITAAAQIVQGLQHIISRQVPITDDPAIITVGIINGGVRNNIIPEEVTIEGTIRTFNTEMQDQIHERIEQTAIKIAESSGAKAKVNIRKQTPVTTNDEALTTAMVPTLEAVAGKEQVIITKPITGAEDFAFYQEAIPGFFFFIGGLEEGKSPEEAAPHHTPDFVINESGMLLGVKALTQLAIDYMQAHQQAAN